MDDNIERLFAGKTLVLSPCLDQTAGGLPLYWSALLGMYTFSRYEDTNCAGGGVLVFCEEDDASVWQSWTGESCLIWSAERPLLKGFSTVDAIFSPRLPDEVLDYVGGPAIEALKEKIFYLPPLLGELHILSDSQGESLLVIDKLTSSKSWRFMAEFLMGVWDRARVVEIEDFHELETNELLVAEILSLTGDPQHTDFLERLAIQAGVLYSRIPTYLSSALRLHSCELQDKTLLSKYDWERLKLKEVARKIGRTRSFSESEDSARQSFRAPSFSYLRSVRYVEGSDKLLPRGEWPRCCDPFALFSNVIDDWISLLPTDVIKRYALAFICIEPLGTEQESFEQFATLNKSFVRILLNECVEAGKKWQVFANALAKQIFRLGMISSDRILWGDTSLEKFARSTLALEVSEIRAGMIELQKSANVTLDIDAVAWSLAKDRLDDRDWLGFAKEIGCSDSSSWGWTIKKQLFEAEPSLLADLAAIEVEMSQERFEMYPLFRHILSSNEHDIILAPVGEESELLLSLIEWLPKMKARFPEQAVVRTIYAQSLVRNGRCNDALAALREYEARDFPDRSIEATVALWSLILGRKDDARVVLNSFKRESRLSSAGLFIATIANLSCGYVEVGLELLESVDWEDIGVFSTSRFGMFAFSVLLRALGHPDHAQRWRSQMIDKYPEMSRFSKFVESIDSIENKGGFDTSKALKVRLPN